ncbi:YceI family protein [Kordia algicida OT-1]|uniref:YCE I like family protein n=1 Tax=Kordia algicida OT-1 TaxID=391587 RepID=A9E1R0_9FLAO|nr:YceI family protein [Kordia algicida]EDP95662.1 YCE I like family protein [Kordia algicida OT-1]
MKTRILTLVALFVFATVSTAFAQAKRIDAQASSVKWTGYKVLGQHEGTIDFKGGALEFKDDKLIGGTFTINMATINTTDLSGEYKNKLDGHLKSADFFDVTKYPDAILNFKKVVETDDNVYRVDGELTIKGKKSPITFDMEVERNSAEAKLKVDRTKYGIKYKSASFIDGLKDKAIKDEFDLHVELKF